MSDEGIKSTWRCPACGRENPATAVRCSLCLAARSGATGIVAEPGPQCIPSAETDDDYPQPRPPTLSRWPPRKLTGAFIIVACALFIPLFGAGLALLVALTPALVRLFRDDAQPAVNPLGRPADTIDWGCGSLTAATTVAILVVISSLITFMAVCVPGAMFGSMSNTYHTDLAAWWLGWGGGVTLGVLAAGGVGYGLVRYWLRKEGGQSESAEPPNSGTRP